MGNDVSRICSNIFFKQIFFANLKSVCVTSFFEKNLWRIILRWLRMTKVEDVKFFCDLGKEIHLKIFTHIRSDSGFRYDSHMIHNYFPRCIYRARHFNVMNRYLTAQKKKRFFFFFKSFPGHFSASGKLRTTPWTGSPTPPRAAASCWRRTTGNSTPCRTRERSTGVRIRIYILSEKDGFQRHVQSPAAV